MVIRKEGTKEKGDFILYGNNGIYINHTGDTGHRIVVRNEEHRHIACNRLHHRDAAGGAGRVRLPDAFKGKPRDDELFMGHASEYFHRDSCRLFPEDRGNPGIFPESA